MARIEVKETDMKRTGRVVFALAALVAVVQIGRAATPVDTRGHLLFLSPRVAEISNYQRKAQRWAAEISLGDRQMQNLLEDGGMDLFAQDGAYQEIAQRAAGAVTEIDGTSVPGSLTGLHQLMVQAAGANQAAAAAVGQWVSAPSGATRSQAQSAIAAVSTVLDRVYSNPWVIIEKSTESSHGP